MAFMDPVRRPKLGEHVDIRHPHLAEENREVLAHYADLTYKLNTLTSFAAAVEDPSTKSYLQHELRGLQNSSRGIEKYLKFQIAPGYFNERRSEALDIVARAFSIVELLELILQYVGVKDIINMGAASRRIKAVIDCSSRLHTALGYKAADATKFHYHEYISPFIPNQVGHTSLEFPGFRVEFDTMKTTSRDSVLLGRYFGVSAGFFPLQSAGDLPNIGSAWKRMLICQPPVYAMQATLRCSLHGTQHDLVTSVRSRSGITVEDLYDFTACMLGDGRASACECCRANVLPTIFAHLMDEALESGRFTRLSLTFSTAGEAW